ALFLQPPAYLLAAWAFSRVTLHPKMDVRQEFQAQDRGIKNAVQRAAADFKEGARAILGNKDLRLLGLMIMAPIVIRRLFEQVVVPIFTKMVMGDPAKSAWIVTGSNFGELLGALLLLRVLMNTRDGKKPSPFRWVRAMALGILAVWAVATGLSLPVVLTLAGVMSMTWAANDISLASHLQARLPNESAGKAVGFLITVELGAIMALSYLLGFVFDFLPVGAGLIGISVAFTLAAGFLYRGYGKLRATEKQK
ncbi:MAG: hypothetical protein PHU21_12285, partial [Elusimicrobia bacterium]|nr:hypothetical protein [Elusimicrobiota bacterium]